MNKILSKTVKQWKIWTVLCAVIIVAGLVLGFVLGGSMNALSGANKTLTVKVEGFMSETKENDFEKGIEAVLKEVGISKKYSTEAEGSSFTKEYIYYFSAKTEDAKLETVKTKVEEKATATGVDFVGVAVGEETPVTTLAKGTAWRAVVAFVVALVAIFAYTFFRYNFHRAVFAIATVCVSVLGTVAVLILARIPVGSTTAYAVAFGMLVATLFAMYFANAMKVADDENEGKSAEEKITECTPVKTVCITAVGLAVALVLVGAIAVPAVRWIAVQALVALVIDCFVAIFVAPGVYLPVKTAVDKKNAEKARYDYKKGERTAPVETAEQTENK